VRSHPHLYEISTWAWLERLSRTTGRRVSLGTVAGTEWDRLRSLGFDLVYLMGVWRRSAISREIARSEPALFEAYDGAMPDWTPEDIVGSPYSISEYVPDPHLGTWRDLDAARQALNSRGMGLVLDFVPNHTAFDHPWIASHPHRYVTAPLEQFRAAPREFRAIDSTGDNGPLYIACGRDPHFPPWTDVAQLNYFEEDTREAMIAQLGAIAEHCDGVRCDMAMLVLDDVFARTWGSIVGRSEPPGEFWSQVKRALPDVMLIAEAYWDLEPQIQRLGVSFTYDKQFYDALKIGDGAATRTRLGGNPEIVNRGVRFLENHDEARSYRVFGPRRVEAAAVMLATAPGMRMYFDGQLEGRIRYSPVQLGRWPDESEQPELASFYRRLLRCVDHPVFHDGTFSVLDVNEDGHTPSRLVAGWWALEPEFRLAVANVGNEDARGRVRLPERLPGHGSPVVFTDQLRPERHDQARADVARDGLWVDVAAGRAHIFRVT
jgi:hypothetical protein